MDKNPNPHVNDLPMLVYGLIVLTIISRLFPHPFNFTSVGSLSLFAGAFLPLQVAWIVPIFTLFVSDAMTGFYNPVVMAFVYIGFACCTLIGRSILARSQNPIRLFISSLSSAITFFIISNFGVWICGDYYPITIDGLVNCYLRGIPYLKNTIAGDVLYSFFLFGSYQLIRTALSKTHTTYAK